MFYQMGKASWAGAGEPFEGFVDPELLLLKQHTRENMRVDS